MKFLGACLIAVLALGGFVMCVVYNAHYYSVRFDFVLEPGFEGELRCVEDPSMPLKTGNRLYTLRQQGNVIYVPDGFLPDKFGDPPIVTTWQQRRVWDTSGRLISEGVSPPPGVLTIRGLVGRSDPDAEQGVETLGIDYFVVSRGTRSGQVMPAEAK